MFSFIYVSKMVKWKWNKGGSGLDERLMDYALGEFKATQFATDLRLTFSIFRTTHSF